MTNYDPPTGAGAIPPNAGMPAGMPSTPQVPRKNFFVRHKILTALLGVLAIIIVVAIVNGGSGDDDAASPASTTTPAAKAADKSPDAKSSDAKAADKSPDAKAAGAKAGLNTPVRDGKFEFTVTKVDPGVAQIGNEYVNKKAQGQFVLVHVTVKNIGDEAQYFSSSAQTLLDQNGKKLAADDGAAIYLEDSNSLYEQINPGNTVQGVLVFDVSAGTVPTTLELHDSAFSGGVDVALT